MNQNIGSLLLLNKNEFEQKCWNVVVVSIVVVVVVAVVFIILVVVVVVVVIDDAIFVFWQ